MLDLGHGDIIQKLRAFYAIAETGSVRRAAGMMNRTPSTISLQLKNLEEELEAPLFDRDGKRMVITPEGEKLMAWTISLFETLEVMKSELSAKPGNLHGTVTLSAVLPLATKITGAVSQFHQDNPLVQIGIKRDMADGVIRDVEESRSDFGLVSTATLPDSSDFDELFTSRPLLILPTNSPFDLPSKPTMENLQKLPFVSYLDSGQQINRFGFFVSYHVGGISPVLQVNNYHLMIHYVTKGLGCALLDELCLHATFFGEIEMDKLIIIPMDHLFPKMKHGIIIRKRKRLSPQSRALLDQIRDSLTLSAITI